MRIRLLCSIACLLPAMAGAQSNCDVNLFPEMLDLDITAASQQSEPVSHCEVTGVIGTELQFRLLLPENWNGKFVMGGGGGFAGTLGNQALTQGVLESGYATVSTDTGHSGFGADWALNNLERITNYGHAGVHRTAVEAKHMISDYYDDSIDRSYFYGCSNGGRQALMEAQRYPQDFDGIVAGAPAYNFGGLIAGFLASQQAMFPDPNQLKTSLLSLQELEIVETEYLARCDANDGLTDGILNNPLSCDFDVAELPACSAIDSDSCFTESEIAALKSVYDGPTDSAGNQLFYGFPFGGEPDAGGWSTWTTGGAQDDSLNPYPNLHMFFSAEVMKYMAFHDAAFDYSTYNHDNYFHDIRTLTPTLSATETDLTEFRDQGGKLLLYQGWSDAAITALGTVGYYEDVIANDASAREDARLFMMPGVLHCAGGKGPSTVRFVDALDQWVESDQAPDDLPAYFLDENANPAGSRPLCAYPEEAVYDGSGSDRDPVNFSCSAP
ncbi:MAG: tannase/feruloyl esterase family alpha/beta hydrolase [Gammaproteobacteria bacterium]|nr:tannase/feruloyl esterase family alpha/beta hydrolase [Gammaproteobacteria bacterium]